MAAIDHPLAPATAKRGSPLLGSIVMAACALPGVMPAGAHAEEAPEQGLIALKISHYAESQEAAGGQAGHGEDDSQRQTAARAGRSRAYATISGASGGLGGGGDARIKVLTPSLYALVPINRQWAAEGSLTLDSVSGASPAYYTDMAGASDMRDKRKAVDLKLTRYFERQAFALGVAHSTESDYVSNAVSAEGRWASDNQNTTWNLGLGLTRDAIDPTNHIVSNESRRTTELQLGVTQAVNVRDLLQASLTLSRASGYLSDPYKLNDARPRERNASIVQLRWNHWLGGSALKTGYRYYRDSYQVSAHTLDAAWVLPLSERLTLTPAVRYYTQSQASFYADPSSDLAVYPGPSGSPTYFSADQRLSAFGALTLGGKLAWQFAPRWSGDVKLEWYRQDTGWRLGGQGSPGLAPLTALTLQVGVSRQF